LDKNRYLIGLSQSPQTQFGKVDFAEQPEAQRVFSSIWAIESQVNNGGFLQYFESDDGETAEYAPWALKTIGAARMGAIALDAVNVFPSGKPAADAAGRQAQIELLTAEARSTLERLDSAFMAYPDNLTDLLFAYVCAHPEAFGPAPS